MSDVFVTHTYSSLLLGRRALWTPLHQLIKGLSSHDQKAVFDCVLEDLSRVHLKDISASPGNVGASRAIAGAAALVHGLLSNNEFLTDCVIEWVSTPSGGQAARVMGMRRALIVLLAQSNGEFHQII